MLIRVPVEYKTGELLLFHGKINGCVAEVEIETGNIFLIVDICDVRLAVIVLCHGICFVSINGFVIFTVICTIQLFLRN